MELFARIGLVNEKFRSLFSGQKLDLRYLFSRSGFWNDFYSQWVAHMSPYVRNVILTNSDGITKLPFAKSTYNFIL